MNLIEGELIGEGRRFRAGAGGFEVELEARWVGALGGTSRRVILGIRPEDLEIVVPGQNVEPGSVISARVELVELLGGEAIVHLTSAGIELTARLPTPLPATGNELQLMAPLGRVHLFDGQTRDRLDA